MASIAYATRFLCILKILMKAVASTSTHCKKESGWVNEDSVNTCSFSLPQRYIQILGSERMLQWLSIGSGMTQLPGEMLDDQMAVRLSRLGSARGDTWPL